MKTLLVLSLIIFGFTTNAQPIANAGSDQTIYLTQTNSVTLNGSNSSVGSYQWTEVSTDYKSGAIINTPTSAITTVSGLPQGVFYFELAVTSGGITSKDVVSIKVDYDVPPVNGNYMIGVPFDSIASTINNYSDTSGPGLTQWYISKYTLYFDKGRSLDMNIDNQLKKFYSTVEDGYPWSGNPYGRAEISYGYGDGLGNPIDSNNTYVIEWKGYFPQSDAQAAMTTGGNIFGVGVFWQMHGRDAYSPPFQFIIREDHQENGQWVHNISFMETKPAGTSGGTATAIQPIAMYNDFYNKTHTIRIYLKEGKAGNGNYIKILLDGNQVYYRNTGDVGRTWQQDYQKFATVYDFDNRLADNVFADTSTARKRGKKFSLVTESFKIYTLSKSGSTNSPPTANAGPNQAITLPTNSATLSGSGSDADGTISSYLWAKISGPSAGTIGNINSASSSVAGLTQGVYQFQLTVTDNKGATGKSTMQVTVNASTNILPTANAGSNQIITLPVNSVSLTGSGSDTDGTISSYQWTKISGPSVYNIVSPNSATTNVLGLTQGSYTFQLKVTDNNGATGADTVQITVNVGANIPPTANAGSNQTITLPTSSAILSGSGSDADGTIASYQWSKIFGPSTYNITSPGSATTNVTGLAQGVYKFQLKVTDNNGATGTDTVQITVNATVNIPPTANAGSNQTITLPTSSASLSGSGSDADGTIASYQWTKISGPSAYNIASPNSATTNVSGLAQGVYMFQLTVTDNGGAIGTDAVQITVNAAANIPPTSNAGTNQTITLPTNSVSLAGSGTDADGTIASYQWEMISGPITYNIVNPSSSVTQVTGLVQGVYQFQLTVTDNGGAIGTATVQIKVNSIVNLPPTANAGSNQTITLPTSSASLSGSGSDADGTIAYYQWTKISGPSGYNIISPNSASTNVSGLSQGVYQFQLTVTDNDGAIGSASVQVTINPADDIAPTADAGSDVSINLPTNSVSLTGSGSDADGTITSYQWTKISGPATYSIVSPGSASTNVSGLAEGVYQFQLTVTDNKGQKGSSSVQVAVNATPNIPPTANAGSNHSITLPTNSISLSGSGSDADGTIASYQWTKISGPSNYNVVNPSSPVTVVSGLVQGVYQFQLTVTDNDGAIGTSTTQITVNRAPNVPPTANAGTNQTITLPTNSLSLSGSGSDADGTISSYKWTKISGPSTYSIVNPTSAATNVTGLIQGVYQFQLTVTDNSGALGTSTVQVRVNAAINVPPTANAGTNQTITLPKNSVNLSGSGNDPDGTIVSYQWTKISGPTAYNIVNPSSPLTGVSNLVNGVYRFRFTVTDNNGAIATATIQITVKAAANIPPTANAGTNQAITLPTNSVSLAGSGNDADGTITSYQWTKISGPSTYNIVNSSSPVTDVSGLIQGIYHFQLTVTDNSGAIGTSAVQITVNAASNKPPAANAGSNQTIILPTNTVSLAGTGSDADGTISSYKWTKISGPSAYNIVSPNSASTNVSGLAQGIYKFQVTVTDNHGAIGTATVQITVNAASNKPPTANAGKDQTIILPTNSVSLAGSGNDADGTIASYQWTKISGPSAYNIVNASSPVTDVSGLIQGVYQFQLTVTDNGGATGTATIKITVNAASNISPTASAGLNQTITLPANSISLSGSGSDADGTISSYQWTKISGPSGYSIVSLNSASTNVSGLTQGVYQFQLTVTDNMGATGAATMEVTVKAAVSTPLSTPNIAPVANAGNDTTIIYPDNSITLNGNGTDADGSVVSYLWNQVSGPLGNTILPNNTASTNVSNLVEGNYQFELTVTDDKGATGKDTVNVTVAAGRFARESNSVKVYPNPVRDVANLVINTAQTNTDIIIAITDLTGKSVYREEFVSSTNSVKKQINMSSLIKGTYIITLYFNQVGIKTIKVMRM